MYLQAVIKKMIILFSKIAQRSCLLVSLLSFSLLQQAVFSISITFQA